MPLQQAVDRRLADEAFKSSGRRLWLSGGVPPQLPIKALPERIEEVFGYSGVARWVAFYFRPGSPCTYNDGHNVSIGEFELVQLFLQHRTIAPHLRRFFFGSSEEPARQWLIVDRQFRQASVVSAQLGELIVNAQWKKPEAEPVRVVSSEEGQKFVHEIQARISQMHLDLAALEKQHHLMVQELLVWLATRASEKERG
jgi:hypothetical protein